MKQLVLAVLILAAPVAAQEKPFDWKLKPEVGSKWQTRTFSRAQITIKTPPTAYKPQIKNESSAIEKYVLNWDVLSRDGFGATTIRVTFRDSTYWADGKENGKQVSAEEQDGYFTINRDFTRLFKGKKFILKISPSGQIWNRAELERIRRMWWSTAAAETGAFPAILQDGTLETIFQGNQLPTKSLRSGETYSFRSTPLTAGMPITATGTRTYAGRQKGMVLFQENSKVKYKPISPDWAYLADEDLKYTGTAKAQLKVDEVSGLILDNSASSRYQGGHYDKKTGKRTSTFQETCEWRTVTAPRR